MRRPARSPLVPVCVPVTMRMVCASAAPAAKSTARRVSIVRIIVAEPPCGGYDATTTREGNNVMRSLLAGLVLAAAWLIQIGGAAAQDWPTRPVRIIIPLAPGGGGDVFVRAIGDELSK